MGNANRSRLYRCNSQAGATLITEVRSIKHLNACAPYLPHTSFLAMVESRTWHKLKKRQATRNPDPMSETLDKLVSPSQFKHLRNFEELHRGNMNRVFVDFETAP